MRQVTKQITLADLETALALLLYDGTITSVTDETEIAEAVFELVEYRRRQARGMTT